MAKTVLWHNFSNVLCHGINRIMARDGILHKMDGTIKLNP
jgi:hypothetical protein